MANPPRPQIVAGRLHVLHVHPARGQAVPRDDGLPVRGGLRLGRRERIGRRPRRVVARVQARPVQGHQRLQPAPGRQASRLVGQVAVDQAVAGVLGLVDDAGRRIDGHGLVVEAAHRLQRHGLHRPRGRTRGHLEVVPVVLLVVVVGALGRLLAGDPAAPRGEAAGAVADGAGEAEVVALHVAAGADDEGGRAPQGRGAAAPVVEPLLRHLADALVLLPEGADLSGPRGELVVADQQGPALGPGEGGHRVGGPRDPQAVVHLVAGAGDHPVGEARGQVDDGAGVRPQGAVARGDPLPLQGGLPPGHVALEPLEPHGDGGGRLQELSSGDGHRIDPFYGLRDGR